MTHWSRASLALSIACTLAACNPLYVRSDVNTALIGSVHCGTYAWAGSFRPDSPLRATIASPLNESRLRAAIAAHLKSPVQDGPANADCLIGYGIGVTNVANWPYYGGGYPYGWGYPYPWGWPGPYAYREGIISVTLYDARSHQPLWLASVDQDLSGASGAEAQQRIDAAVTAIFTKYPG
ncbi:MAG TPA: DUF4136 domain-containing protein [Steroidobacteraceae bacterium]|jgi:hypothetical protein|nr:DUF4136 domain-containing protein [Steroidobacteraceae bacterium]